MTRVGSLKHVSCGVFSACFLAILAPAVAPAQEAPPRPFLRKVIQLDDAQLAAVEKGEVVTKLLPTTDKPEIAAFGVVKTAGTVDQLLALARDVQKFRQVPQIPEMGHFSSPAKIEDLAGLTHPPDDIAALKRCKPGSCDVKLGTKGLELVSKIDWNAADAEKQAVAIFNQAIVDYVTAYQQGGTDAMGNVLDKKQEKSRAAGVPDAAGQLALPRGLREGVQRLPGGLAQGRSWPGPTTSSTGRRTPSASSRWSPPTTRPSTRAPAAP